MLLHRGINLGGYLSQCNHSFTHYETFITEDDIARIAKAGFDHVRLPIDYNVPEDEDGRENFTGYTLIDRVVDWCGHYGLDLILDLHKAYGYDFNDAGNSEKNNLFHSEVLQLRFLTLWKRLAARYGHFNHVAFELLNEVVEGENAAAWNGLIGRAVKEIRHFAPTTPIIYGGIQWNNINSILLLDPPQDENIIWTFHFYSPMPFTHQKAPWCPQLDQHLTTHYPNVGEAWTMEYTREMLREGVECAAAKGVPLYCGEFGVIDKAPLPDTLRWFQDVDCVFREYGIGCSVWTYKSMNFGIFGKEREPIREDLIRLWMGKE